MQKPLSLKIVIALIILIGFSFKTTFACQGSVPPACVAYSQARNVFSGKLIKIEKTDTDEFSGTNLYFEVIKTYKGEPNSVQIVPYSESDCGITFVEGESYLVYKNRNANL